MENNDLWKVMKWIGYVYIPVAVVFVVVYLIVSYRTHAEREAHPSFVGTSTGN
jgi:hypothetical protein